MLQLRPPVQAPLSTGTIFPSHMEGFLHPLGGPATGVYSFVSKPVGLLLGNVGQERSLVTGPAIGGGRQSFQGRPTPTDTGIIIRRRRSAKRRAKRSLQVVPRVLRSPAAVPETVISSKTAAVIQEKVRPEQRAAKGSSESQNKSLQDHGKDFARKVNLKEAWTQTENTHLRDQFTQVEEEEQQARLTRWLVFKVVEESLREVIEEEEERGVRRSEKEEERKMMIRKKEDEEEERAGVWKEETKIGVWKDETNGARKVKWAGNVW